MANGCSDEQESANDSDEVCLSEHVFYVICRK